MRLLSIHHINYHNFVQEMNMCHIKKFVLPRYLYQSMHMASPSLPSVETSYSLDRAMIHCIQWMHSTPWVLSGTALAGLQFIILAWHEAGKIPAADSVFLFFPLRPNTTFSAWLSLDLAWRLSCRIHPRPTQTGKQSISDHSSGPLPPTESPLTEQGLHGFRQEEELAGVPGYPSEKNKTLDSFSVAGSGSGRNRAICVVRWRTFYKSSLGLWTEQCLTCLLPADPGTQNWRNIPQLTVWAALTSSMILQLPVRKMQAFSKSHEYLLMLYFGSGRRLQVTIDTHV